MTQDVSATGYDAPVYSPPPDEGTSTKDVAKDQAAGVAGSAKDAGQHVAGVAKDEAANVAGEASRQAKDVIGQARDEVGRQAADQQQRAASGLRSLGSELGSMADNGDGSGVATDLARQASSRIHEVADWLEQRDPAALLDEVKSFARRRPGAFVALAVGAGLAAGRLTRGLKDESSSSSTGSREFVDGGPATQTGAYSPYDTSGTTAGVQPVAAPVGPLDPAEPLEPVGSYGGTSAYDEVEIVEVVEPAYPTEQSSYRDGEPLR